ncbi:hypothetical protein PLICRDRAFT_235681 [Plicaturopsis crispa FD-325 SS-3]|nr:hypothetical protein PLICRDRAFT_235681 [Plicaturopsis crispa FD-325 SS-3]
MRAACCHQLLPLHTARWCEDDGDLHHSKSVTCYPRPMGCQTETTDYVREAVGQTYKDVYHGLCGPQVGPSAGLGLGGAMRSALVAYGGASALLTRDKPETIEDIHPRYVSVEKSEESHSATTQSLRPSSKESNALRTSHVRKRCCHHHRDADCTRLPGSVAAEPLDWALHMHTNTVGAVSSEPTVLILLPLPFLRLSFLRAAWLRPSGWFHCPSTLPSSAPFF